MISTGGSSKGLPLVTEGRESAPAKAAVKPNWRWQYENPSWSKKRVEAVRDGVGGSWLLMQYNYRRRKEALFTNEK
jgi:hypothetical protein